MRLLLVLGLALLAARRAAAQMGIGTKDWIDSPITSGNKSPPGNVTVRAWLAITLLCYFSRFLPASAGGQEGRSATSHPCHPCQHLFHIPRRSLSHTLNIYAHLASISSSRVPPLLPQVFVSAYLDRLISVDEEAYTFHAKTYLIFSWVDPRAPEALKNGTDEMIEKGGECAKPCSGQRMLEGDPTAGTCCTKVWAPAALFRNVYEFPQGRTQPYVFYVSPDGRVSYRVEVNGEYYSPLQLRAYPLDTQVQLGEQERKTGEDAGRGRHRTLAHHLMLSLSPFTKKKTGPAHRPRLHQLHARKIQHHLPALGLRVQAVHIWAGRRPVGLPGGGRVCPHAGGQVVGPVFPVRPGVLGPGGPAARAAGQAGGGRAGRGGGGGGQEQERGAEAGKDVW